MARSAGVAMVVALALGVPASAPAAQVMLQPQPAEARTFATSAGGWTPEIDYGGVCAVPGLTCPRGSAEHVTGGGAGGPGDGFLRSRVTTVVGLLSNVVITWSSPSFTAPPQVDRATLAVAVRGDVGSLVAINGSVRYDLLLIDTAAPGAPIPVAGGLVPPGSGTFAPIRVNVAGGTIRSGRSYRVALRTHVRTPLASLVTTGSVDFDAVELRLVDLEPPSGLTATVPGTGPARVSGGVDPHDLPATVVVEYGPTSSYGASAGPVTVEGAGAQSFTIPLAGLTPGATYHYRVTAQNADGTVSTDDATFTAPRPPSDAPPLVTGSLRARDRVVIYDRGTDLENARIEVRDGDGDLVGSDADADADGIVTIALPDQDATYQVRVVRESSGGMTSTSADVPAVLDREGPDTAGVGLEVQPASSADRLRSVTFIPPADAVAARLQALDGNGEPVGEPVDAPGGTASVQLGAADGAYRVRLTLVDAAGNAADVLSDPLVLDQTAPGAGAAPAVTPMVGNDRRREVSFERDPSATTVMVEVLDEDGDPMSSTPVTAGGSTQIELPDTDATYQVRVRQADDAGNAAVSPVTPVTLDRRPPPAGSAPTVAGAGNQRERTVSFWRDPSASQAFVDVLEPGGTVVATIEVPAAADRAAITLPDADGRYDVRVRQQDAAGNEAASPVAVVTLDRRPPSAGPAPGVEGPANARTRTVAFERAPDAAEVVIEVIADGNVVATVSVPSGDTGTIVLPDADGEYGIRVRQTDAAGNSASSPATSVTLDRVPPSAGPAPRTSGPPDRLLVTFERAPDAASATIEVLGPDGRVVARVAVASGDQATIDLPDEPGDYLVRVVQSDAAGNSATSPGTTVTRVAPAPGSPGGPSPGGGDPGPGPGGDVGGPQGPGSLTDPGRFGRLLGECYGARDLALTSVRATGRGVRLRGLTRYAPGTRITIIDDRGRRVATAAAGSNGRFAATAKRPSAARRARIRYRAVVGGTRSRALKLTRANTLLSVRKRANRLEIHGRIDVARVGRRPRFQVRGGRGASACRSGGKRLRISGRVRLDRRTGRYTLRVRIPRGRGQLVLRTRAIGRVKTYSVFLVR